MASNLVQTTRRGFGGTMRRDGWWWQSLFTFLGFSAFIVYSTWASFQGEHYAWGQYLSPMYSPLIWEAAGQASSGHSWLGAWPAWMPTWILVQPITPAILILWAPGGFRFTCYYYRGAYYKAFWADPPACAVGEPKYRGKRYRGERWLPLVLGVGAVVHAGWRVAYPPPLRRFVLLAEERIPELENRLITAFDVSVGDPESLVARAFVAVAWRST
jgi:hypothetical protein